MHLVTVTWFSGSRLCMLMVWVTKEIKLPEDDFADSRRRFRGLDKLRSPKDRLEDSHKTNPRKTIPRNPKDDSTDPKRRFRGLATDDPRLSTQTFMKIRDFPRRLSQKSETDYRGNLRNSVTIL